MAIGRAGGCGGSQYRLFLFRQPDFVEGNRRDRWPAGGCRVRIDGSRYQRARRERLRARCVMPEAMREARRGPYLRFLEAASGFEPLNGGFADVLWSVSMGTHGF